MIIKLRDHFNSEQCRIRLLMLMFFSLIAFGDENYSQVQANIKTVLS